MNKKRVYTFGNGKGVGEEHSGRIDPHRPSLVDIAWKICLPRPETEM